MNKSLILVFTLITVTIVARAQTSAGNMMAGGSIDFNSFSREGGSSSDESSFTFSPSFGYFISDNFAVGTSLTLGSSRSGTGAGKSTGSTFGIGPFARYYKYTSNENLAFFGQASLSFATGKTDPAFGAVSHSSDISFAVSPGAAYFFNEHWAAEVTLRGFAVESHDPNTDNKGDKATSVGFALSSLSPTLGFRYHF